MKRLHRLTSSREFERVLRAGARARTDLVTAVAAPAEDGGPARLGVTAGRSIGRAVARNRAKRLLREAARAAGIRPGVDVVLIARPACAGRPFDEVRRAVAAAVRGAGAA